MSEVVCEKLGVDRWRPRVTIFVEDLVERPFMAYVFMIRLLAGVKQT
jgi:hypothetical protein